MIIKGNGVKKTRYLGTNRYQWFMMYNLGPFTLHREDDKRDSMSISPGGLSEVCLCVPKDYHSNLCLSVCPSPSNLWHGLFSCSHLCGLWSRNREWWSLSECLGAFFSIFATIGFIDNNTDPFYFRFQVRLKGAPATDAFNANPMYLVQTKATNILKAARHFSLPPRRSCYRSSNPCKTTSPSGNTVLSHHIHF